MAQDDTPAKVATSDGLGPLPPHRKVTVHGRMWTEEDMRAYALQERAAERERCAKLCELESVTLATRDQTRGALYCAQKIRA